MCFNSDSSLLGNCSMLMGKYLAMFKRTLLPPHLQSKHSKNLLSKWIKFYGNFLTCTQNNASFFDGYNMQKNCTCLPVKLHLQGSFIMYGVSNHISTVVVCMLTHEWNESLCVISWICINNMEKVGLQYQEFMNW